MKVRFDRKVMSRRRTNARQMMTVAVLALVFGLGTVILHTSTWAAEVVHSRIKGSGAFAFFATAEQCIVTNVIIEAFDGVEHDGPGRPGARTEVFVLIEQLDTCQDVLVLSAEGTEAFSASEFQIDKKLESARLIKTLEVLDSVSGDSLSVSLDLTWTAIGQPEVVKSRFYMRSPGRVSRGQERGTLREATATGAVLAGGTNVVENSTDVSAGLQAVTSGSKDVIKF
jgi:hypothetical protein